ncbi:hypothetical protein ADILRU_0430 [Leifsonia rubra CMS 76R]|nr:hypothetical protein ADILRU_0430 [Leifsonia rubra CMS 76R]
MAKRRVQFWRITDGVGDPLAFKFPAEEVVNEVATAVATGLGRYLTLSDGAQILGQAESGQQGSQCLILYNRRTVNLPRHELDGVISTLALSTRAALAEATFFVFLPRNIVAVLYNQQGPSAGKLAGYLQAKLNLDIALEPIYRQDALEILANMDLSKLVISIDAAQAHLIQGSDDSESRNIAQAVDSMAQYAAGGVIEVAISVGTKGVQESRNLVKERIHRLAMSLARSTGLQYFNKAKAYGREGGTTEPLDVDLLHDRLVFAVEVEDELRGEIADLNTLAIDAIQGAWQRSMSVIEGQFDDIVAEAPEGFVGRFVSDESINSTT